MNWYIVTYIVFYLLSGTILGLLGYILWLLRKYNKKSLNPFNGIWFCSDKCKREYDKEIEKYNKGS